jgi:hypothetical protein
MKAVVIALMLAQVTPIATAAEVTADRAASSFSARLQPAPVNSGFQLDGYWVWCGSAIKADGEYHLFAARWPKDGNFPEGYRDHSEIVRATAKDPQGPYTFREVVIGRRQGDFWDSHMAHNPTIHKIGDTYVLFYIGSDGLTRQLGSNQLARKIGYATAQSIEGPWQRSDQPIIAAESNNPAVYVEPDGAIKLMYRDANLRVCLAVADSYAGKFRTVNDNVWPAAKLEDFYLFKTNGAYHVICEDNVGQVTGHVRWGAHLQSTNGLDHWVATPEPLYTHDITRPDGSILHCVRRERPQLLIQDGKITHLFTAVYDGKNSWNQPVALAPPLPVDP